MISGESSFVNSDVRRLFPRSFYPSELCAVLRQRWSEEGYDRALLPTDAQLEVLIDAAYQASMLREEDDPVQCRVLVISPDNAELAAIEKSDGLYVVNFDEGTEFSPNRIRKISGAVGYYRSLIGVHFGSRQAESASIWGMIVTGTRWVNQTEATVHATARLPHQLVVHILGPGHLMFAAGLTRVVETIGGQLLMEGIDPFRSQWLPKNFEPFRNSLVNQFDSNARENAKVRLCESFVRDVAQSIVRRTLSLVRSRARGGMLIYLHDAQDPRLDSWLRIRMRFHHAGATNRFQQMMLRLMKRALEVGHDHGIAEVRWKDFLQMHDASLGKLHDALIEFSHFMADLMSVDGALVLDGNFKLIGFGAEILGDSHVSSIERALDLEGESTVTEQADASGTRHRSAYRLVSSVRETIVVVISQDGAVRFVAHRGGRLVYWPYLP